MKNTLNSRCEKQWSIFFLLLLLWILVWWHSHSIIRDALEIFPPSFSHLEWDGAPYYSHVQCSHFGIMCLCLRSCTWIRPQCNFNAWNSLPHLSLLLTFTSNHPVSAGSSCKTVLFRLHFPYVKNEIIKYMNMYREYIII